MPELSSYDLSDFLLFSPRVYARMFVLHNEAVWPLHVLAVAVGLGILWALVRRSALPFQAGVAMLGLFWIWIAWVFFWQRYATINWAAVYVAPAFVLEGVLLIGMAVRGPGPLQPPRRTNAAAVILALAVLVFPIVAVMLGRAWQSVEVFGVAPDPTAIATLGVLAAMTGRQRWLALPVPVLWCLVSGLTVGLLSSAN